MNDYWGGAIFINSYDTPGSSVTISNNQFINNVAYFGGAIYLVGKGYSNVIIKDNIFDRCSAEFGGALSFESNNDNSIIIENNIFDRCSAKNGGAISFEDSVHVVIKNNQFKNLAALHGAIVEFGNGKITFSKNTISNCKASENGDYIYSLDQNIVKNIGFSIKAHNMVKGYKSGLDYKAIFYDMNGNVLKNYLVFFKIKGKTYKVRTDSNGVAKLNINLAAGDHNIEIINPETGDKLNSHVKIMKRILSKSLTMTYGDGSKFTVRIVDNNGKFVGAGQTVKFKIKGKTYTVKTNKKGFASLKISFSPKKYTINTIYKGFKVSNNIKVKPIKLYSKWWLSNGKPLVGKTVIFKIKSKTFAKVKTNKFGYAYANLKKPLKKGSYKVTAACSGKTISMKVKIR
ncbi:polymorphic outer membrane protein repeat-containing protein [Methanobrevibacter gottschalkii]|uniref:Polymorphic outer membrane protein repeat-containing protein n=1 Tax=Methanobrevibacter gottschalkii TaxID=190974 RepID=A0A1H7MFC7_9EURY|nr:right-handed parallel beta-helix repeat-containing protein [Methanobrevibacter gottschalkii]SEL09769.1 polymorphic outer membrane protein repeat-containing protein [Methanobrevibacter gottschalkii]